MKTVTESALVLRINRQLRREGGDLRLCRARYGTAAELEMGRYYLVTDRNCIHAKHCDLEDLAIECGVLKPGEVLA